jgi:hypothetical protein
MFVCAERASLLHKALVMAALLGFISACGGVPAASAQILGTGNPNAPYLPFVYLPTLQGEARATMVYMDLTGGREFVYSPNQPAQVWGLKDDFAMNKSFMFFDSFARLTVGPFSARIHYEPRAFVGVGSSPGSYINSIARLEYSGARLGGDIDIFRSNGSRVGFDFDYDLYYPIFTEGIRTSGGKIIQGEAALTLGGHVDFRPTSNYWGMNPIFDANVRWPVFGTQVVDYRLAGGLTFPQTVLGVLALKIGYRKTSLDFRDSSGRVETSFGGFFGELAYYYY